MTVRISKNPLKVSHIAGLAVIITMILSQLPLKSDGSTRAFMDQMVKKRLLYDDLSMPQWLAGQLTNILHMQGHVIARQALVQVIAAMKDPVSICFTAMKNACSVHEQEEGNLAWGDYTQRALNRLRASQVLMIGSHSASPSQKKFMNISMKDHAHTKVTMIYTSTIAAFVAGKVTQQIILKINVILRIRSKKDHQTLLVRA